MPVDRGGVADAGAVRALGRRVLDAYGIDAEDCVGLTLDLNPYGVQTLVVRLSITPAALLALAAPTDGQVSTDVASPP